MDKSSLSDLYGVEADDTEAEETTDEVYGTDDDQNLVMFAIQFKEESEEGRQEREARNQINYDVAHCRQDMSDKVEGQSVEFLPDTAMAAESLRAFIKGALVSHDNWFQVKLEPDPTVLTQLGQPTVSLTPSGIEGLIKHRLEDPRQIAPDQSDISTTVSDAIYTGAFSSLMVAKVHGKKFRTRRLSVDFDPAVEETEDPMTGEPMPDVEVEEELVLREGWEWRPVVELIRTEDYFPDPTGRGLGEMHRTRMDLYQVMDEAESMGYDQDVLDELAETYRHVDIDLDQERETNQNPTTAPVWRKEVELWEYWGNILDGDGHILHRNIRMVIANQTHVLLPPEPNPWWHQESPFVVHALIRIPFSVYHKALFDDAVRLNLAKNEIFNLALDGAIAAVWGNKQVHGDLIANIDDFQGGIPQSATFYAKQEAPVGQPLVLPIDSGTVPHETLAMLQLVKAEFEAATKVNTIQLGQLPKKDVRATEVAASEQASQQFFDAMITEIERQFVTRILWLVWLNMLQNADDWTSQDVAVILGPETAKAFSRMSPARRYYTYGQAAKFTVSGMSATLARAREFQKLVVALQMIMQNPILAQTFMQDTSPKKILHAIYTALNIDPESIRITDAEKAALPDTRAQISLMGGMMGGNGGGGPQTQAMPQQQGGSMEQGMQAGTDRMAQMPQEM